MTSQSSERKRRASERAFAKINLFLEVNARREDGFHELATVMHTVSLCDEIAVTEQKEDALRAVSFYSNAHFLPRDQRNLAVRAAMLFAEKTGYKTPVRIDMKKCIPVAAGLAGGSSDAAAVLRAMNRLSGMKLSYAELCELGAELGSDVPFCIAGGTALCTGRGEQMTPIDGARRLRLYAVIAIGEQEKVSTPAAFSALDSYYANFDGSVPFRAERGVTGMCRAVSSGNARAVSACLFNNFETVVLPMCEQASALKARMLELGALGAMMSGSGPSVFGIFDSYASAVKARDALGASAHTVVSAAPTYMRY